MPEEQRLLFGTDARLFDRVRPSYPAELIDDVVALVGSTARAVDAGCGTGKATVALAERGLEGVGVEPHPAMAEIASEKLAPFQGWRIDVSDFEDWQPRRSDLPVDLVTAAQAWHWIDRERGARQAERVLRRGGWLAIFGHRPSRRDTPLRRAIDAIHEELAPRPSVVEQAPRDRVPPGSAFGPPVEREYHGWDDYTAAQWIDVERTSSDKRMLPAETRDLLLERLEAAINEHGGTYRHHWVCRLWAAERL
ncbi:MAG TPA: class I SAM-dependent methyltransferase [Gaiellaceae bacterium]|nr:class I SAM-dependent methyltransferase [Gaiellaceae bacterium]